MLKRLGTQLTRQDCDPVAIYGATNNIALPEEREVFDRPEDQESTEQEDGYADGNDQHAPNIIPWHDLDVDDVEPPLL